MGLQKENHIGLMIFLNVVISRRTKGKPVNVVYLDFQKCFGKMPHKRLLSVFRACSLGIIYLHD